MKHLKETKLFGEIIRFKLVGLGFYLLFCKIASILKLKKVSRLLLPILLLLAFQNALGQQSSSVTYTSGDIPTSRLSVTDCASYSYLQLFIPAGATVTSTNVSYNMTSLNGSTKAQQYSYIYHQETNTSEPFYALGQGITGGTQNYNRTINIANGVSSTGVLTFLIVPRRNSNIGGCDTTYAKVDNNTWKITVNYIEAFDQCDAPNSGNVDTDEDNISDICDEDDDNDGISDEEERNQVDCTTKVSPSFGVINGPFSYNGSNVATPTVGDQFIYNDVYTGVDAIVTIVSSTDTSIVMLDVPGTTAGVDNNFQPQIQHASPTSFTEFKIDFVVADTNIPAPETTYIVTTIDNDLNEFVTYKDGYSDNLQTDTPNKLNTYTGQPANVGGFSKGYISDGTLGADIAADKPEYQITSIYALSSSVSIRFGDARSNTSYHSVSMSPCLPTINWSTTPLFYENIDTDRDGIPNHLDSDSDNDGCSDADEAYYEPLNNPGADTDNNGYYGSGTPAVDPSTGRVSAAAYGTPNAYYINNRVNTCEDNDNDGVTDYDDLDDDNDGILDTDEGYSITPGQPVCTDSTQLNFNQAFTEESGDGNIATFLQGEVFRFPNVTTGIDALVTIIELNNTTIPILDDNSVGNNLAFQPKSSFSLTNTGDQAWTEYKFEFVNTGTTTPTNVTKFFANFNDVDGGANYGEQNWSQLPVDYSVNNPTELTITHPGSWIVATSGYTEYPSVTHDYPQVNYSTEHSGSSYIIRLGAVARVDGATATGRQHQVEFKCTSNYVNPDTITILDTDGDGIPNHYDLDSDNDGCPDAIEGAGSYDYDDIDARYTRLKAGVNVQGIPNNGTSQTVGTSTNKDVQSDICSPCNSGNPKFQDFDGDGIGNICDNDDDNDGIPDGGKDFEYEKTIIIPGECTETQVEWLHNNDTNDTGYDKQSDYATFDNTGSWRPGYSLLSSPNFTNADDIVFGGGLDEASYNTSSTYIIGGVDKTTFEEAKTNNDYVQLAYTPAVDMNLGFVRLGFSTPDNGNSLLNLGKFFVTLEMSTDANFATSDVLYYDGHVGKIELDQYLTLGHQYDIDLEAGTKYYYRFYIYNENNTYKDNNVVRFDDVKFQHRINCQSDNDTMPNYRDVDSDNDGCPDALEGSGTYSHTDIDTDPSSATFGMLKTTVDTTDKESDTYGVPGGITQTIGTSQNAAIQSPACYIAAYNDINQTPQDIPVNGALLTNDENIASVTTVKIGTTDYTVPPETGGTPGSVTITNVPGVDKDNNTVANAGTIIIRSDGTYTFTPAAGFTGIINPITYTGEGTNGATDTASLTIKVIPTLLPGNNPPTAQNDVSTTEVNTTINSTILTNDSDPDGDTLTVTEGTIGGTTLSIGTATPVSGKDKDGNTVTNAGTVTLNANGTYIFVPTTDFTGTVDDITYTITDPDGATDTAILSIDVINNYGTSANEVNTTEKDTTLSSSVTLSSDPDEITEATIGGSSFTLGTPKQVSGTDKDGNTVTNAGTVTINEDGTYVFDPEPTFVGTIDDITYTYSDPAFDNPSNTDYDPDVNAILSLKVIDKVGNNTFANDDANAAPQATSMTGNIITNDFDPELDTQTFSSASVSIIIGGTPTTITINPGTSTTIPGVGELTINADGSYTFNPLSNFVGTLPVTYIINDNGTTVASDEATLYLTTLDSNNIETENDINQTPIDTPAIGNVLTNDSDPDGGDIDVSQIDTDGDGTPDTTPVAGTPINTPNGSITIDPETGAYTFTPTTGFTGTETITYQVCDDDTPQVCGTAVLTIVVIPTIIVDGTNNPPIAQNDTNGVEAGETVTSTILSNDSDTDGDTLTVSGATGLTATATTVTLTTTPQDVYDANGNLTGQASLVAGQVVFTANSTFIGQVPIEYTISDGNSGTDTATLIITVDPASATDNDVYANDDASTGVQNIVQTDNVLTNDTNPDAIGTPVVTAAATTTGPLTVDGTTLNTLTSGGTLVIANDGTYTYTPANGFVGTEVVTYQVCDNGTPQACDDATLYLTTLDSNNIETENDINQTPIDTPAIGNVLTNDSDPDGGDIDVSQIDTNGDGIPDATPVAGNPINTPNGSITIDPETGAYTFTPTTGFTGTETITYIACDDDTPNTCETATLTIVVIPTPLVSSNNPPIAQNDTNGVEAGETVTSTILSNDSDTDGDTLTVSGATGLTATATTVTLTTTPQDVYDANGNLTGQASLVAGQVVFTANSTFIGQVPIEYTISDGNSGTDTATLIITVDPASATDNDVYANDDASTGVQNIVQTDNVLTNDTNPDAIGTPVVTAAATTTGPLTVDGTTLNTLTSGGTLVIANDGTYTYTPANGFVGTEVVTYQVCDNGTPQACDDATLYLTTLDSNNIETENDINQTPIDTPAIGNVLTNDSDPDGGDIDVSQIDTNGDGIPDATPVAGNPINTPNGSITIDPETGAYTFTPTTGFTGTETITYIACDDDTPNTCETATLTIVVIPTPLVSSNNPPIAQNDTNGVEAGETVTSTILSNDSDTDGDTLTVSGATGLTATATTVTLTTTPQDVYDANGNLTGQASLVAGQVVFTANSTFIGQVPIEYTISDGNSGTDTATLIITVDPASATDNDVYANDDASTGVQNIVQTDNVLTNDTNPDAIGTPVVTAAATTTGPLTVDGTTLNTLTSGGTLVIANDGTYTYTPANGFVGTEVVTYQVCDNGTPQACDNATLYLTTIPNIIPADAMITQVYLFGDEKWIEITNIGTTIIPANTILVQLYKNKTGSQTGIVPDVNSMVETSLNAGESVLFKTTSISTITNLGTTNIQEDDALTDIKDGNDIITLSNTTGLSSWANRYDVASNIVDNTSVVRIDERLTPNKDYTASEWVVFIDDAIAPYQSGTGGDVGGIERHPQDPLISEIKNSDQQANTLLGLHRINKTIRENDDWNNGFPDRSRYVVIDQYYNHTGSRLSARKLEVNSGKELRVTDNLLVVTNSIVLDGNIRLSGPTSQLVQTHTNSTTVTGGGKLFIDQKPHVNSKYRYNYMSSPVTNTLDTPPTPTSSTLDYYTLEKVLKDGTTPNDPKEITFAPGYDGSYIGGVLKLADYWVYTYAPGSNGRSNWEHKYKAGEIDRGDGFIFKGPDKIQNYTFAGTPNDGLFYSKNEIDNEESYLIGNPFPSAMNARKFINDNISTTSGTLYFWQHVGENNGNGTAGHNYGGYIGGYASLNKTTSVSAYSAGTTGPVTITLQAEDAEYTGELTSITPTTGVSLDATDYLKFSNISSGIDILEITYAAVADKTLKIKVNGADRGEINFTSNSNSYTIKTIDLCLEAGSDITLTSTNDGNSIKIDQIVFKDEDGQLSCSPNTGGSAYEEDYKDPQPYIAVGQGFFVVGEGIKKEIKFNNSQRAYVTEESGQSYLFKSKKKTLKKSPSNDLPILKLGMNYANSVGSNFHRQIAISFDKANSFAYENGFDSKMYDVNPTDFYWKFANDVNKYVIAGVQEISDDLEVPLEVVVSKNSVITIVIDDITNISQDIYIKDKYTGKTQQINNTSASYQLKTGTYTDRFVLAFVPSDTSLSLEDDILAKQTSIFADNKNHNIVISKNQEIHINNVTLFDLLGKEISLWNIKEQKETYQLNIKKQIPTGIYIVKMKTDKGTINKKIVIE